MTRIILLSANASARNDGDSDGEGDGDGDDEGDSDGDSDSDGEGDGAERRSDTVASEPRLDGSGVAADSHLQRGGCR